MSVYDLRGPTRSTVGTSRVKNDVIPGKRTLSEVLPVQQRQATPGSERTHELAQTGVDGSGVPLPFLDQIQRSFGPDHDLSGVRAYVGGDAAHAASTMGAYAYTTGEQIAFATDPDLALAAHEAAHVVQQRAGVQLHGGVGQVGDVYERQADSVAERVVQGRSAAELFGPPMRAGTQETGVQHKCTGCGGTASAAGECPSCKSGRVGSNRADSKSGRGGTATQQPSAPRSMGAIQRKSATRGGSSTDSGGGASPSDQDNEMVIGSRPQLQEAGDSGTIDTPSGATGASGAPTATPVYICAKDLATSPLGKHAFFRFGGIGPGNPTMELEPEEVRPGCYQGIPQRNFSEDYSSSTTNCLPIPVSQATLDTAFGGYPIGQYCTLGPNSNTFIGVLARGAGVTVRPSGWLPGFDDSPPTSGTFSPSPLQTLLTGCSTSDCPPPDVQQMECMKDAGGCGMPAGIPTEDDMHRWNTECRQRTGYQGPDIIPTSDDCAGHGPSDE
jgi:hypothetical protein